MYHISDLKKFNKCQRFYYLDNNESASSFQPYLRSDESYIDLLKERLNIVDCFTGKIGDENSAFLSSLNKYEWFVNSRLQINDLRIKVPLIHKINNEYDIYFLYYGTQIKELDLFSYRITTQILETNGLLLNDIYIVYINPDYVFHKKINVNDLFIITNKYKYGRIINIVQNNFVDYSNIIDNINNSSLDSCLPIKTRICRLKNTCPYYDDCFENEKLLDDDSILTLVSSQYKNEMFQEGIKSLKDVDLNRLEGNKVQYAQIMASKNGGRYVEKYMLKNWLSKIDTKPISFIDFEWDRYLIPSYESMRPLDVIPFEFVLYVDDGVNELSHKTFISNGDCRREFIETLISSLPKEGPILAYNALGAEVLRLKELASQFKEYEDELNKIADRFVDLAVPFIEGLVYDTKMKGDYSLKKLVSVVSDKSYKDLDINEGMNAVYKWRDLNNESTQEKEKTIDDLKKYCSLDAYGLFLVYKWLKNLI